MDDVAMVDADGDGDIFDRFQIDFSRKLGEGGYGATYAAVDLHRHAGAGEAAVKVVDTKRMRIDHIRAECDMLERLDHPNIIQIFAHGPGRPGSDQTHLYFIFMECASGGELFDQVIDRAPNAMPDDVARGFFAEIIAGVQHCHERGICHRDLKQLAEWTEQRQPNDSPTTSPQALWTLLPPWLQRLENVLITREGQVKVIDFGLSHPYERDAHGDWDRSTPLKRLVGSKSYVAPEVLSGAGYEGFGADVWSLGVSLFAMLAGFFPLSEAHARDWRFPLLETAQLKGASTTHVVFGWYKKSCAHLSEAAVDLLDAMLCVDVASRATLTEVIRHAWFRGADKLLPPMKGAGAVGVPAAAMAAAFAAAAAGGLVEDGPRWRGARALVRDEAALGALLAGEEEEEATAPVYRALGLDASELLPLPAFERQYGKSGLA